MRSEQKRNDRAGWLPGILENTMSSIDWTNRKKCETPEELEEAIADMMGSASDEHHARFLRAYARCIRKRQRRDGCILWSVTERGRLMVTEVMELQGHA
jgi:hypothetical protein